MRSEAAKGKSRPRLPGAVAVAGGSWKGAEAAAGGPWGGAAVVGGLGGGEGELRGEAARTLRAVGMPLNMERSLMLRARQASRNLEAVLCSRAEGWFEGGLGCLLREAAG